MNVNLVILTGADNRADYIRDTLNVSEGYFKEMFVIDTGSTDDTEVIVKHSPARHVPFPEFHDNWNDAFSRALTVVPAGEWFLFMDSDERPSQVLLDNIVADCEFMQGCNVGIGSIPNVLHYDGRACESPDGKGSSVIERFPKDNRAFNQAGIWTKSVIIFNEGVRVESNGSHSGFVSKRPSYYFPHWYNHLKTPSQLVKSAMLCSWCDISTYSVSRGSQEWRDHERLKSETGLKTSRDIDRAIRTNSVPQAFMDLWKSWENSKFETAREYFRWAHVYGFQLTSSQHRCGDICCRYKNAQL